MSGRPKQRLAGCHAWCPLHILAHVCKRSRQRKILWLGCLSVAAVVVIYLPLIFHSPTVPTTRAHQARTQTNTELHSIGIALKDTNLLSLFDMDKVLVPTQFSKMFMNTSLEEDTHLNSLCEASVREELERGYETVTLIFSLRNILTEAEAIFYIRQHLQIIPSSLTEDVIITAETNLSKTFKETIEEFADLCPVCRLLFLPGNIYQHWNAAAKFARSKYLIFVDARVSFSSNSLQTMIKCLQKGDNNTVVSPQLRLKYADGRVHNVGLSRNEITWDLGVSRGAVSYQVLEEAQKSRDSCINQTVISKEIFGIRKQFFANLGGFDIIPYISGGEHVSFSLKVLSCYGNIVTSLCSEAYLTIANTTGPVDTTTSSESSVLEDYHNPSFYASHTNISAYYIAGSKPWVDAFTAKYYTCSVGRQIRSTGDTEMALFGKLNRPVQTGISTRLTFDLNRYINSRYGYFGYTLKQYLVKSKCIVGNFRYIVTRRQPHMLPPTKSATFYGYIRTLDGMYAFGRSIETPAFNPELRESQQETSRISESGTFILTRNTSLWIGPFSYTNGAFIYKNIWCLTVSTRLTVSLQKCVKGKANQLFTFSKNTITLLGLKSSCVSAKRSSHISSDIFVSVCSEPNTLRHFKLDTEFDEKCIK